MTRVGGGLNSMQDGPGSTWPVNTWTDVVVSEALSQKRGGCVAVWWTCPYRGQTSWGWPQRPVPLPGPPHPCFHLQTRVRAQPGVRGQPGTQAVGLISHYL